MAIPFLIPSEEDSTPVSFEDLCAKLDDILMRIEILRRSNGSNRISRFPRVCCNVECPRRVRRVTRVLLSAEQVASLNNQSMLNMGMDVPSNIIPPTPMENLRYPSLRPCCSNPGILSVLAAVPDLECGKWIKDCAKFSRTESSCIESHVCTNTQKLDKEQSNVFKENCSSLTLFSKILPYSLSSSLWTAIICMVGWHLLRAR